MNKPAVSIEPSKQFNRYDPDEYYVYNLFSHRSARSWADQRRRDRQDARKAAGPLTFGLRSLLPSNTK